jgi:hypothetical protein
VFVGEGAIQGGDSWPATIQRGVEECQALVILCSPTYGDAVESPWSRRELVYADIKKKKLFPVWHSGVYAPRAVGMYFCELQRFPGGNLTHGYAHAAVSHEAVAEELAAALILKGIQPSGARADAA